MITWWMKQYCIFALPTKDYLQKNKSRSEKGLLSELAFVGKKLRMLKFGWHFKQFKTYLSKYLIVL